MATNDGVNRSMFTQPGYRRAWRRRWQRLTTAASELTAGRAVGSLIRKPIFWFLLIMFILVPTSARSTRAAARRCAR
jgi:hypothetical protein